MAWRGRNPGTLEWAAWAVWPRHGPPCLGHVLGKDERKARAAAHLTMQVYVLLYPR